jgi:hypothetical protein
MEPSERDGTGAPRDQERSGWPFRGCCGGDFTSFGSDGEGCFPGQHMAGMEPPTSEDAQSRASCPMARVCSGMTRGGVRGLGLLLVIPAAALLSLGAAILLVPQALTWLVAGGLIAAGGLILVAAVTARRAAPVG